MFYVSIDIAKYKHDFAIIDEHGLVIVPPKTISNSQEGFNGLLVALSSLDRYPLKYNQHLKCQCS